jgi:hypothetical protein
VAGRNVLQRGLPNLRDATTWIAWVRLIAVPFVFLEVGIEHGNYPAGYERWAWGIASVFAIGAAALFAARATAGRVAVAGYVFDLAVLSAFVVVYSFEPASPVRELLFLPVVEAAIQWGRRGGVLAPLASTPALAVFEWKVSDRLGVPYDAGHIIAPVGLQLLVGLIVGALRERADA